MPIDDKPIDIPLDRPVGRPEGASVTPEAPTPAPTPSMSDLAGATFRQENLIGSALTQRARDAQFDIEYDSDPAAYVADENVNPWEAVKGTKYEQYFDSFLDARTTRDVAKIKNRIDLEEEDRKTIAAAPFYMSLPMGVAAGILDPTVFIPGGAFVKGAKGGFSVARSALSVGAATAAAVAVQEAGLQGTQETRTAAESAVNIGSSAILGGILGAAGARLLSGAEIKAATEALDRELAGPLKAPDVEPVPVGYAATSENIPAPVVERVDSKTSIRAFHGSRAEFDAFDPSYIGTGEGFQALGKGFYFTDIEDTAQKHLITVSRERGGSDAGLVYEVEIKAGPEKFLDWNKPLSDQSEAVKSALGKLGVEFTRADGTPSTGSDAWRALGGFGVAEPKLVEAGVIGARAGEEGQFRYSVFDDSVIEVKSRKAVPPSGGEGGAGGTPTAVGAGRRRCRQCSRY